MISKSGKQRRLLWPCLLAAALVLPAAAGETNLLTSLAARSQGALDAATGELAAQRETIASEKVPQAQDLSRLESQLADARRDYEQSRRAADNMALEMTNLRNETKGRQEEMSYLGNLLDEFARSFEGRVHVSELQRYAPLMEAALGAAQNKDLTLAAKFDQQLGLVRGMFTRLEDLVGGARFPGQAVDPQGLINKGVFALIGPVALFASENNGPAGLALAQAGSTKPLVRPLEAGIAPNMASIVTGGAGLLPLDPTRGDALKALIAKGSLWGYFKKGGPIMWPLLVVSLLAFTVILERIVFLLLEGKRRNVKVVGTILDTVARGDVDGAIRAGSGIKDFVVRCLVYAMEHRAKSLPNALMRSAAQELRRYNRGISFLDTVVTMAPLLGLLGTVTGMIGAFGMLGGAELSAPAAITGGIAEALIATTFGLGIAIVTLIPLNFLHSRCEDARHELEDASTHLELLMKPILEAEEVLERYSAKPPAANSHHAAPAVKS